MRIAQPRTASLPCQGEHRPSVRRGSRLGHTDEPARDRGTRGDVAADAAEHDGRHCQVVVGRTGSTADDAVTQTSHSDTRHLAPGPEGTAAEQAIVDGSQQVTTEPE